MILAHDMTGTGPDVVLLHSTVCDRRMWEPQWRPLADAGLRVVRADFRSYGSTPSAGGAYSDAGDVLALMDTLGIERAALVGASYGGRIALEIAAREPHRITALALLCAGLPDQGESEETAAYERREVELVERDDVRGAAELSARTWLGPEADAATLAAVAEMQLHAYEVQLGRVSKVPPGLRRPARTLAALSESPKYVQYEGDPPPCDCTHRTPQAPPSGRTALLSKHALAAADEHSGARDFDPDALATARVPALVLSGAHDMPEFRRSAARLAALLPGARHEEQAWAGHLPSLERPAEITRLLTAFLASSAAG
ncbi:alpha/beta fold hydrolase [Streptomyces sp. NPDC004609]|uniref:alpha/beta fold hydrolase n=1 Tax=Streptomyces sp. NPDC004609 TaxID=3364704 RepID=UPI0036A2591A